MGHDPPSWNQTRIEGTAQRSRPESFGNSPGCVANSVSEGSER